MKTPPAHSPILDASGRPMVRAMAYEAGSRTSQELGLFNPSLGSADRDYLPSRNTIVARTRHLVQNSGWASSAVTRHLDSVIGIGFRPSVKPDYLALGLDKEWARTWARKVEARWRVYAEDPLRYMDAARRKNFTEILRTAYREWLVSGEAVALSLWKTGKPGKRCATTFQLIDSDQLSNPYGEPDSDTLRGGVEVSELGAPTAYHFRDAHPGDFTIASAKSWTWTRVPRETPWGRLRVIHAFEEKRPNQTRGISRFAPVVERFKMLDRYDKSELQAALLNAVLAAAFESPMDSELLFDSISEKSLNEYQTLRSDYHKEKGLTINGVTVPALFPGEKLTFHTAARPNVAFADFERACLRNISAALGITYEQLTSDWSQVNYSSARAAIMEVWKTLFADRTLFADQFATPIMLLWLEEEINAGNIEIPDGAPNFYEMPGAYLGVKWIGTGRGYVDPEKEAKGANMRINTGISTLEDECAEQGKDYQEVLEQRAAEIAYMKELGLPLPDWASAQPTIYRQGDGDQ